MPIQFRCPHCQTETIVDDHYAGQTGPCVECGKPVTIPELEQPHSVVTSSPETKTRSASKQRSLGPVLLVIAVSGIAALIGLCLLVAVGLPIVQRVQATGLKNRSTRNLQKIATAMRLYEADYGCLPPPYVVDQNGRPVHSWRVLLLPYMGYEGIHADYDFSQPWDSTSNMLLIERMPDVYASPTNEDGMPNYGETNYMVVVGPGCAFRTNGSVKMSDISDGPDATLIVVEANVEAPVQWTNPQDLNVASMDFSVNGQYNSLGGSHPDGANVLMADDRVRFLPNDVPADYVEGMTTISGREVIPIDGY